MNSEAIMALVLVQMFLMAMMLFLWFVRFMVFPERYHINAMFWTMAILFPALGIIYVLIQHMIIPIYLACKRDWPDFIRFQS